MTENSGNNCHERFGMTQSVNDELRRLWAKWLNRLDFAIHIKQA